MQIVTSPYQWNSLFDPDGIKYIFDHEAIEIVNVSNAAGFVKFTIDSAFTEGALVAGDTIFIPDTGIDAYTGFHTVSAVFAGTQITTTTAWTGVPITFDSTARVKWVRLPEIKLYAGALPGETWDDDLELTLLATFTPRNHPVLNQVVINVAGWLRSAFQNVELAPPVIGGGDAPDFNLFNYFRLYFDDAYDDKYFVAFSTIPTLELNEEYVGTGRWLTELNPPVQFTCGPTLLQKIEADGIYTISYEDGVPGDDWEEIDFDPTDFG